ncbi:TPA: hypothetical protein ACH3X2_012144 [Trebouxia sp. C0005]|nr:MAG: Ceramide kinase [Trebouxia sp. A1-2]
MIAEQQRPGHKHKNSLLASPFEQVTASESTQTQEGESVALISPAAQSSQRPSMRRMSGKALFAEANKPQATPAESLYSQGGDNSTAFAEAVFILQQNRVSVTLTSSGLQLTRLGCTFPCFGTRRIPRAVSYDDILSASHLQNTSWIWTTCCSGQTHQLVIHTFKRSRRRRCLWRPQQLILGASSADVVEEWAMRINSAIWQSSHRPRDLLVLLNPFGGTRKAKEVWRDIAMPVFNLAGVRCMNIETERAWHARQLVSELTLQELNSYDGIVAVGGDGLFQEIMNGLLDLRAQGGDMAGAAACMRLGHIPAGSTDAVAYSINGTRSQLTAALHIALGDRIPLDVLRVDTEDMQHRFAVCVASYGYMGDLMKDSEKLRWMGPARYNIQGAITLFRGKAYTARISWLPAPLPGRGRSVCGANCTVCVSGHPNHSHTSTAFNQPSQKSLEAGSWQHVEGDFKSVMAIVTPCRSDQSALGLSPYGHLSDGRIQMVLVHKCSVLKYLRFLAAIPRGGIEPGQFSYIEVLDVTAMRVEPVGQESSWNVDGELLENNHVTCQVHKGLVEIFARGVEL